MAASERRQAASSVGHVPPGTRPPCVLAWRRPSLAISVPTFREGPLAMAAQIAEGGRKVLEIRDLVKEYPGVTALRGVDFDVREGEVHCLLGPNGAGKSTLIKCVSGAVEPTSGEITFDGEPLPARDPAGTLERGVATIYQELDL